MNLLDNINKRNKEVDFLMEFDKEVANNSDRGIALICGSIMDKLLHDLLKMFFIKKNDIDNNLFKNGKPLGTFDSKMKTAFYLGLITKAELSNITYIQRIRNRFAHDIIGASFENEAIKDICSNFNIPKNSYIPSTIPRQKKETEDLPYVDLNPIKKDTSAKYRFIYTFRYLYMNLINRTYVGDIDNREEYTKQETADKAALTLQNRVKELIEFLKKQIEIDNGHLVELAKSSKKDLELLEEEEYKGKKVEDRLFELEKEIILNEEKYELKKKEIEEFEKYYVPIFRIGNYTYEVIKNSLED